MNRLPWFPMWTVEHKSETARWSLADEGAYIRLMCEMWQVADDSTPPGIVDDSDTIADVLGVTLKEWDRTRRKFLKMAQSPFRIEDGMIRHERLDSAYHAAIAKSEQAKRAIQKRWDSERKTDTDVLRTNYGRNTARNTRNDTGAIPSQNLEPRTQKVVGTPSLQVSMLDSSESKTCAIFDENEENAIDETTSLAIVAPTTPARSNGRKQYPPEFEAFWESYPNKTGKDAAYRAWRTQQRNLPDTATLTEIIQAHRAGNAKWLAGYIPNPATWLNQGRWQDALMIERQPDPLKQALAEGR